MAKIILASQSPQRKKLLEWAGIDFETMPSNIEETYPPGLTPGEVALHISRNKALDIKQKLVAKNDFRDIIAADSIVVLENRIIGKPIDYEDAIAILTALSGKIHTVITGVCIIKNGEEISFADITEVEFYELSRAQIIYYVDNYKPFDKAGAYAIQEWIGVTGIKRISGDFYNVMGLPVSRVVKALDR